MRTTMLLAMLTLTAMLTASAQTAAPSAANTLTGCLKGSADQYYIVEQNGHRHTLMAKNNQDLSSYVNHQVTVTGKADASRSTAPGSDSMGHRGGFFSVDSVSDQGACKKK